MQSPCSAIRIAILSVLVICLNVLLTSDASASVVASLYGDAVAKCDAPGLENLFSSFVCNYHQIVDQVLSSLFITMYAYFRQPVIAALSLTLILTGATFALGMLPFTTRDTMILLAKLALVMGFALNGDFFIETIYDQLISFMRDTTDIVVGAIGSVNGAPSSVNGIFEWMDLQFYQFISLQDQAQKDKKCEGDVLGLIFALAATMPPIFAMGMYLLFQLVMVFVRTVMGYLLALTGIMFLTTMAPLFLSFALFRFTSSYFEKWLAYMLGFSMQIFIVFSFIAVVLSFPIGEKLRAVSQISKPYDKVAYHDSQRFDYDNWCTLCATEALGSATAPDQCKGGNSDALSPTSIQVGGEGNFINWIGKEIIMLAVLAYIVEVLLKAAPQIARNITSIPYAPTMAGQLPMAQHLGGSITGGYNTFMSSGGGLLNRSGAAFRESVNKMLGTR